MGKNFWFYVLMAITFAIGGATTLTMGIEDYISHQSVLILTIYNFFAILFINLMAWVVLKAYGEYHGKP